MAKAQGFIVVDLRGTAVAEHLASVGAAINGEGRPEFFIFVPRVQLPDNCNGDRPS